MRFVLCLWLLRLNQCQSQGHHFEVFNSMPLRCPLGKTKRPAPPRLRDWFANRSLWNPMALCVLCSAHNRLCMIAIKSCATSKGASQLLLLQTSSTYLSVENRTDFLFAWIDSKVWEILGSIPVHLFLALCRISQHRLLGGVLTRESVRLMEWSGERNATFHQSLQSMSQVRIAVTLSHWNNLILIWFPSEIIYKILALWLCVFQAFPKIGRCHALARSARSSSTRCSRPLRPARLTLLYLSCNELILPVKIFMIELSHRMLGCRNHLSRQCPCLAA